jgi:hypothetical protein
VCNKSSLQCFNVNNHRHRHSHAIKYTKFEQNACAGPRAHLFVNCSIFRLLFNVNEGIPNLPAHCESELILKTSAFFGSLTLRRRFFTKSSLHWGGRVDVTFATNRKQLHVTTTVDTERHEKWHETPGICHTHMPSERWGVMKKQLKSQSMLWKTSSLTIYFFFSNHVFLSVKLIPNFRSTISQKTTNYRRNRLSVVMFSFVVLRSKSGLGG